MPGFHAPGSAWGGKSARTGFTQANAWGKPVGALLGDRQLFPWGKAVRTAFHPAFAWGRAGRDTKRNVRFYPGKPQAKIE